MLPRHGQTIGNLLERVLQVGATQLRCKKNACVSNCNELPRKLHKTERKPPVTSFNELKREARLKRKERQTMHEIILQPPENGLLVEQLITVAHQVYAARPELLSCVSRRSLCGEVHVGHPPLKIRTCDVRGSPSSKEHSWIKGGVGHVLPLVESYSLYDRIGRAVLHNEMLQVDRIPAIVEFYCCSRPESLGENVYRFFKTYGEVCCPNLWILSRGTSCQAYKHQMRDGQHAWQEATINDLVPPVYVYHVRDQEPVKPLVNQLKRYYGMLPAVVEPFAQAGALVQKNYTHLMREHHVVPEIDEEKLLV